MLRKQQRLQEGASSRPNSVNDGVSRHVGPVERPTQPPSCGHIRSQGESGCRDSIDATSAKGRHEDVDPLQGWLACQLFLEGKRRNMVHVRGIEAAGFVFLYAGAGR